MATRMIQSALLAVTLTVIVGAKAAAAPTENYERSELTLDWSGSDESSGNSSYLGVDIDDVSAERLSALKLKEEHGVEITMVDQDAPAGKADLHPHDVIISVNGTAVESTAQMRRIIKETPPGRVVNLGISRDGQPQTVKVQLADKHKSMAWEPKFHPDMPKIPEIPSLPDFDLPVSVVIVHSSARSGLMVENISPQLGDYFGVKGGNGILVRSVEKGSSGEKAGFHAGDVIVKVNNQPVHDTSDFTHVLRASTTRTASVTVIRERREQNLTLTLPEKKDSGNLIEESVDNDGEFTAQMQDAISHATDQIALMTPALVEQVQAEVARVVRDNQTCFHDLKKQLQDSQSKIRVKPQQFIKMFKERQNSAIEWADI